METVRYGWGEVKPRYWHDRPFLISYGTTADDDARSGWDVSAIQSSAAALDETIGDACWILTGRDIAENVTDSYYRDYQSETYYHVAPKPVTYNQAHSWHSFKVGVPAGCSMDVGIYNERIRFDMVGCEPVVMAIDDDEVNSDLQLAATTPSTDDLE